MRKKTGKPRKSRRKLVFNIPSKLELTPEQQAILDRDKTWQEWCQKNPPPIILDAAAT